ncbi:MAG: LysM peptidoglycan-binding domain-containing protein, partial [Anaerolineae bacterium]|nr:LysM peptidoglycan-binding domain-containing protein [Anaerolineae bacterium]
GGTDPWSPNIIWAGGYSPDQYRLIGPVQAQVGPGGVITVFLRATAKWAYKHNDAYWDDASLVYVTPQAPPTRTPLPPPPTPTYGPSPTPRPTPTPRPDGAIVHIVEAGDTLYGIALRYGVDVNPLRTLNAGSIGPNDLIQVGQELVVSLPVQTPTPLPPPPTATPESIPTATPESIPATTLEFTPTAMPGNEGTGTGGGTAGGASICVLAYHDRNGNTFRDDAVNEELLPNAEITVANDQGAVARYVSDGIHEPHCFTSLAQGAYRVILKPPAGYQPSGYAEWSVAVAEGTTLDIQFGIVRGAQQEGSVSEQESAPTSEATENPSAQEKNTSRALVTVARIGGIAILVFALVLAVLFAISQRRV